MSLSFRKLVAIFLESSLHRLDSNRLLIITVLCIDSAAASLENLK